MPRDTVPVYEVSAETSCPFGTFDGWWNVVVMDSSTGTDDVLIVTREIDVYAEYKTLVWTPKLGMPHVSEILVFTRI